MVHMTKVSLAFIAISLIVLVIASGCVFPETDAINQAKSNPVVADFLGAHINAQPNVAVWSKQDSLARRDYLVEKCGPSINPTDYYYVTFQEGNDLLETWVYQKAMVVACAHRSDDECVTDAGCDEGDLCTIDKCSGIPKKCSTERIRDCMGGDGCCPDGCTFTVDYDCKRGDCAVHRDCDDRDPSTNDFCSGDPKKCRHENITDCRNGDGYCPTGCSYSNDKDCPILSIDECETDADCDDLDESTVDSCLITRIPAVCMHEEVAECGLQDDYCPPSCDRLSDGDCFAAVGDLERIIVSCDGSETTLSSELKMEGSRLAASFNKVVSAANNDSLNTYENKTYKYNNVLDGLSDMIETVKIRGKAVYERRARESFFLFHKDGLSYELNMPNGIPATNTPTGTRPFVSGNDDKVVVPFFGKDAFVVRVDQEEKEVQLVSDMVELAVAPGQLAQIEERNNKMYRIKIDSCDSEEAVFALYKDYEVLDGQIAKTGDLLFPELLEKTVYLSFLNFDRGTEKCEFKYANGTALEIIKDGSEFPEEGGWMASLEFSENRLRKITLTQEGISSQEPLERNKTQEILTVGSDAAKGFCEILFTGLFR